MAMALAMVGETVPKAHRPGHGSARHDVGRRHRAGPALGGVLIGGFGWRAIFLVNVPLGLLTWLLAHRFLPADRASRRPIERGFDAIGTCCWP